MSVPVSVQVVFVCTGNTCRSPMAAVLFEALVQEEPTLRGEVRVVSAGLHASPGSGAASGAIKAVASMGLRLDNHRARRFDEALAKSELILTMTKEHKRDIVQHYPHAAGKVYTLKEYAGELDSLDISDPFGQDDSVYHKTLKEIEAAVRRAVKRLAQQRNGSQ